MVFTRYKIPAMPLTINLDATSKTATFFATFVLIATFLFIKKLPFSIGLDTTEPPQLIDKSKKTH